MRVPKYLLANRPSIETVSVPEGVVEVGEGAFKNCYNLATVALPSSLITIGTSAMEKCPSIVELTIPAQVATIGNSALNSCSNLRAVSFPNTVTSLGTNVCQGCEGIAQAHLPEDLVTIPSGTFSGCKSLSEVNLPAALQSIGASAFVGSSIATLTVPDGVTSIGASAFQNNDALRSVVLPNSVSALGKKAFYDCDTLVEVSIGTGLSAIADETFRYCGMLGTVVLPYTVRSIGSNAFAECGRLTSVHTTANVTSIADNAFSYCEKITLYGARDSYAHAYAIDHGIAFSAVVVEATSIVPSITEVELKKGETVTITVDIQPTNVTDKVAWQTSDSAVATVDTNGKVKAVGGGWATISVVVGEKRASIEVFVNQLVTGLSLSNTSLAMKGGESCQLVATTRPNDATNTTLAWSSSDPSVASVDDTGVVRAAKSGSATITCATTDGSDRSATCKVTVTKGKVVARTVGELESAHPYAKNSDEVWTYTIANAQTIFATFDEQTLTEAGKDFIYALDENGTEVAAYTGDELAGQTIIVDGNTLTLRLTSNASGQKWGFKVTNVGIYRGDEPFKDGWVDLPEGSKGYAKNGELVTGWLDLEDKKYYFNEYGQMCTGWTDVEMNGKVMHYYFNPSSGNLVRNTWFEIDGKKYYFRESGNLATGWATISDKGFDKKYYFEEDGTLVSGCWCDIVIGQGSTGHYYFRPSGAMATEWATIDGEKYFFRPSGNMATGFADVPEDSYKRYFDESGRMLTGWQQIGGKTYYFRESGAMQTGKATIDGVEYEFTKNGVLIERNLAAQADEDEQAEVENETEDAAEEEAPGESSETQAVIELS